MLNICSQNVIMPIEVYSHLDLNSCTVTRSTTVWIVFTNKSLISSITPSPRIDQQVYLYNTATSIITENYWIGAGSRVITNVIGKVMKKENKLNLYTNASFLERRNNFQGAIVNIVVEHCGAFLELKNSHELSEKEVIRQINRTAFSYSNL
jgi:hypothetical protein